MFVPTLFNGVASLQLQSHIASGQAVRNTVHVWDSGLGAPPTYAQLLALATDFWAYVGTTYKACLATTGTVDQVIAKTVADPTDPGVNIEAAYTVNAAGTLALSNEVAPSEACAILSLKTQNASRRFRGHLFMPPAQMARQLQGEVWDTSGSYYTAVAAFAAKLDDGCGPSPSWTGSTLSGYELQIYSNKAASLSLASLSPCTTIAAPSRVHWLRSRGRGTT